MGRAGGAEEGGEGGQEGEEHRLVGGDGAGAGDQGDVRLGGAGQEGGGQRAKMGGRLHSEHFLNLIF